MGRDDLPVKCISTNPSNRPPDPHPAWLCRAPSPASFDFAQDRRGGGRRPKVARERAVQFRFDKPCRLGTKSVVCRVSRRLTSTPRVAGACTFVEAR